MGKIKQGIIRVSIMFSSSGPRSQHVPSSPDVLLWLVLLLPVYSLLTGSLLFGLACIFTSEMVLEVEDCHTSGDYHVFLSVMINIGTIP